MKYLPQYYTAAYLRRDPYDPGTDGGPYLVQELSPTYRTHLWRENTGRSRPRDSIQYIAGRTLVFLSW